MERHEIEARRLVGTLDSVELQVLRCVVSGMSDQDIELVVCFLEAEPERVRTSMMTKLRARRVAEAVRIGLYAEVDRSD